MGRPGGRGRGGRNLGSALARASGTRRIEAPEAEPTQEEVGGYVDAPPAGPAQRPRSARRNLAYPKPRARAGRRNRPEYSARSISVLENLYERLDQVLADPELQRRIRAECEEWGVWVPQKKAGKSEVMELLLMRWLEEIGEEDVSLRRRIG